jgi:hypothetical protein
LFRTFFTNIEISTNRSTSTSRKIGNQLLISFHYHKKGHWFRNCKKYLEEQKKMKKGSETFTSGINVMGTNIVVSFSESWVFDTGSMIHTYKSLQGLSLTRRFAKGELDVRAGNGAKVAAIAVNTYHLALPSGLVLELNNCYYISS